MIDDLLLYGNRFELDGAPVDLSRVSSAGMFAWRVQAAMIEQDLLYAYGSSAPMGLFSGTTSAAQVLAWSIEDRAVERARRACMTSPVALNLGVFP